jgi:hypothetical protein
MADPDYIAIVRASDEMSCGNCRFYSHGGEVPEVTEMGTCRRYPPTIHPRICDAINDDPETDPYELRKGFWPWVWMQAESCGEYVRINSEKTER